MLSRSVRTPSREGQLVPAPKAAATRIYGGAIVCSDAQGLALPGAPDAGLAFLGVAESEAISSEREVQVRRNVDFLLRSVGGADAVTAASLGRPCYIVDDEFVASSDGGGTRPAAGIVTGLEPHGRVWVRGEPAQSGTRAGATAGLALVHSPAVSPAVERMGAVPGRIRGSAILDISDLSAFTAVSAGTLVIGGVAVEGIDLSAATTINDVVNTISAAVQAVLPTYTVGLDYINPAFFGRILRSDGDVPAIGGTLEPLFGFAAPAETVAHVAASPNIVLPAPPGGGDWRRLSFRMLGQTYEGAWWHCISDFWMVEDGSSLASYFLLNNSGGWSARTLADPDGGPLQIGAANAYNLDYFEIEYDPASREISWRPARDLLPSSSNWAPSIDTLAVTGA